ncbi:MAG: diguanylate cyclase [Magnetococcales bacterium]|nr:diguanylate cyclase [Magnetococcales bacterium]
MEEAQNKDDHKILDTILLVDDQPENIDAIKGALDQFFAIKIATRGTLAIKITETNKVNLILLDVMMPDMDGFEVCRKLKENTTTRNIPIIFLTSKDTDEDEVAGLKLGAVDFIRKPSNPLVVLTRARNAIALHSAQQKLLDQNIQLHEMNRKLNDLISIDGLTGIPNRRRFDEYLVGEWNGALRRQEPLSIIVIDIDYFKLYNDGYGHVQGDQCLIRVAKILSESLPRSMDLVARYGGEEFACILPNTNQEGMAKVGAHLRRTVNALGIPHEFSKVCSTISISLGGATMTPCRDKTPYHLIALADQQLYRAKDRGRNRLEVASFAQ